MIPFLKARKFDICLQNMKEHCELWKLSNVMHVPLPYISIFICTLQILFTHEPCTIYTSDKNTIENSHWRKSKQICPKSDKKSYWYFHHKPCSCPNLSNNFKYIQIFLLTRNYSVITAAVTNWGGPMLCLLHRLHWNYLQCLPNPDQGWTIGHKWRWYEKQTSFYYCQIIT